MRQKLPYPVSRPRRARANPESFRGRSELGTTVGNWSAGVLEYWGSGGGKRRLTTVGFCRIGAGFYRLATGSYRIIGRSSRLLPHITASYRIMFFCKRSLHPIWKMECGSIGE